VKIFKISILISIVAVVLIPSSGLAERVFICQKPSGVSRVYTNRPVQSAHSICQRHRFRRNGFNKVRKEAFARFKPLKEKFALMRKIAQLDKNPPQLTQAQQKKLAVLKHELGKMLQ